ncbi:uncharacterized protein FIESC28_04949 [Fusarium coffeatum]|uniref:Uncharacterized protein n=1 Tax=Fusarium coffeatum TaxID=231269 RepID=A0A366RX91_9HYPO|nr:uncharacterized protein FIESC28_04949 [Fusarium coffeatum]RBR21412.1 hypothetical protein FIESC28_04949 [Fusarium coffeatum]
MESQRFYYASFPASLDGWLEQLPDADTRSALREVFYSAYREVDKERAEAEVAKEGHQSEIKRLEAERKALRDVKAKLDALTGGFTSRLAGLTEQMSKSSGDVTASQPTVEETLQAINDASGSENTQESVRLFSEDLTGRFETVSASVRAVVDTVNQFQVFARNVQLSNELNDTQRALDQEANKTRNELSLAQVELRLLKHRKDAAILQLQESQKDLRVRLSKATRDLEQAQPKLQQVEGDARDLEIVTTQLNVVRATVDDLRGKLAQAERVHQDCAGKLAEVHGSLGESVMVKQRLERDYHNTVMELSCLQSHKIQTLQQRSEDQRATERRELMAQLADARSRETEALNSQLKELADKTSLVESHKREADTLRMALEKAKSELADAEADIEDTEKELNQVQSQHSQSNVLVGSLQTQLQSATEKLEAQDARAAAHHVFLLDEGEIGSISKVLLELANELSGLPVIPAQEDKRLLQVVVNIEPMLHDYSVIDALMGFLESDPQGWYCLTGIISRKSKDISLALEAMSYMYQDNTALEYESLGDETVCRDHDNCILVRAVGEEESLALEFFNI